MAIDKLENTVARFAVSRTVYAEISTAARWHGISISAYVRGAVLEKLRQTKGEICRQEQLSGFGSEPSE